MDRAERTKKLREVRKEQRAIELKVKALDIQFEKVRERLKVANTKKNELRQAEYALLWGDIEDDI